MGLYGSLWVNRCIVLMVELRSDMLAKRDIKGGLKRGLASTLNIFPGGKVILVYSS